MTRADRCVVGLLGLGICIGASSMPRGSTATSSRKAAAASPVAAKVPFRAGEELVYDVSWSGYVSAATVTLKVVEKKPSYGSAAYYITAEAKPTTLVATLYSLYYKADTLLDSVSLLSQRGSLFMQEGSRQRYKVLEFDQRRHTARYVFGVSRRDVAIPASCQDFLSALYLLRAKELKAGVQVRLPVLDSARVYAVELTVVGEDTIATGLGRVPAWRVSPTVRDPAGRTVGQGLALWISKDSRRLPLKVQAEVAVGSLAIVLSHAG